MEMSGQYKSEWESVQRFLRMICDLFQLADGTGMGEVWG